MSLASGQFRLVNNRSGCVVARLTHRNLNWSGSIWQMIGPEMRASSEGWRDQWVQVPPG
jgi:hypothetical protein